jgi:hypothetical protein
MGSLFTTMRTLLVRLPKVGAIRDSANADFSVTNPSERFHPLNLQGRIFKGTVEKQFLKVGDKIGASEANLLRLLGINVNSEYWGFRTQC